MRPCEPRPIPLCVCTTLEILMASPIPKNPEDRQRRNKPGEFVELPAATQVVVPEMPEGDWCAATVRWWESWRRSPQAARFGETAWRRLEMLVPLVEDYCESRSLKILAELRLNERALGGMPEDMQRLRWRFADVGSEAKPTTQKKRAKRNDPRKSCLKSG